MNSLWSIAPWILLILGTFTFVVILRRLRRALAATQITLQRTQQAIESTTDAVGIGDFEGNSLYHNRAHVALFGYTVEELNAKPGGGVLFADKPVAQQILASVFAGHSWVGETEILTKDGRRLPAYVRADVIRDGQGKPVGIFGVFRDISRERKLAEDTARANRLDSLGMMAGRIAHDFSNLITVMMGYVDLALSAPGLTANVRAHLERIEQVTTHARDLTQQLKTFAKGETPAKREISLTTLLRESVDLSLPDAKIVKRCDVPAELPLVMADEGQIRQVINNLVTNAAQAMPKGGSLTVTGRVIEDADVAAAALEAGKWVRLSVADTGEGIPPENLARLFEPFFTTKASGTGLGLATCFSIVARHGGHLRVESTVGQGTTFHVFLRAL